MEKVLTQEEIDALFRAAWGANNGAGAGGGKAAQMERWNLHEAGRLRKEQLHSLSQLHESFARNLTHSLGAYLRDKFEVALVSVEQLAYREFLARVPDVTYYASFQLQPAESSGVLQLDLSLAFPVIDLLLGGQGQIEIPNREVSEIEELILEGVGHIICRELGVVWQPLGVSLEFEQRQAGAQMLRIMPAQEKVLALSFEVTMPSSHGALNIAVPAVVSNALLRKLSTELVYRRRRDAPVQRDSIRQRLLDSPLDLVLGTPTLPVKLGRLLAMRPGQVLCLQRPIGEPGSLRLGGRDCWLARPVQSGARRRAAQLVERLAQPEEKEV
jgi:flagellar motor switch protein FliM